MNLPPSKATFDTILSVPWPVEWAGWRTDTLTLSQCGWQIAIEFDASRLRYRLMLKHHEMRLTAFSDAEVVDRVQRERVTLRNLPPFRICHVAETFHVLKVMDDFSRFREIDPIPQFRTEEIRTMEDPNIFAPCAPKAKEVLVDKADLTVVEHLEAIKALQSDKQRDIRDRLLLAKDAGVVGGKSVVAQLVSYSVAA